jgi:hypothetical protein
VPTRCNADGRGRGDLLRDRADAGAGSGADRAHRRRRRDDGAQPIAGATCTIDQAPDPRGASGADGYVAWDGMADSRRDLQLTCTRRRLPAVQRAPRADDERNERPGAGDPDAAPRSRRRRARPRARRRSRLPPRGRLDLPVARLHGLPAAQAVPRGDGPARRAVVNERIAAGCNTFRVLGMVDSFASLRVDDHYYERPRRVRDFLAGFGARWSSSVFADAQIVMPDASAEKVHADMVARVLAPKWNVFVEAVNEPFKNMPGGAARGRRPRRDPARPRLSGRERELRRADLRGDPRARRLRDGPQRAQAGLAADRARAGRDPRRLRAGARAGIRRRARAGGRRRADRLCRDRAAGPRSASVRRCRVFCRDVRPDGRRLHVPLRRRRPALPWPPVQHAAAEAFYAALQWVPAEAQLAPYIRGGTDPGCRVARRVDRGARRRRELRSFAKVLGDQAWLVQLRTTRAAVVPCGAWRVVETPRRGLARLVR